MKFDKELVDHVAYLARIKVTDYPKYEKQLSDILTEIDKINKVDIDCDIMITSCNNKNAFFDDKIGYHLTKEETLKNSKNKDGNYIVVPKVIE